MIRKRPTQPTQPGGLFLQPDAGLTQDAAPRRTGAAQTLLRLANGHALQEETGVGAHEERCRAEHGQPHGLFQYCQPRSDSRQKIYGLTVTAYVTRYLNNRSARARAIRAARKNRDVTSA